MQVVLCQHLRVLLLKIEDLANESGAELVLRDDVLDCLVYQIRNVLVERSDENSSDRQEIVNSDVLVHLHLVVCQKTNRS